MTPILLPPDLENAIAEEARRRGLAPETLAVDGLRRLFAPGEASDTHRNQGCLLDFALPVGNARWLKVNPPVR